MTRWVLIGLAVACFGCGETEEDRQRAANESVAAAEKQAQGLKDRLRTAYDDAYERGKKIASEVGTKASDEVTKAKVLTAFKLMKNLDSSKVKVRVEKGVIFLDGTVPTEQERMMAEGLVYGITGDGKRVRSTITVPKA
jgi:osmotically-inducible protein OsmY